MRARWLLALLAVPGSLAAQQRITLRAGPAPNQTIRLELMQDLLLDMTMPGAGMGPMSLEGRLHLIGLEKVGTPDPEGRLSADLSVEQVTLDMKMNGVTRPAPEAVEQLQGKTFVIVYDARGRVVEVKPPEGLAASAASAQAVVAAAVSAIPSGSLAVGDTLTVPVSLPVPIPVVGDPAKPLLIEMRTTSKLVAIEGEGADRIATLEQTTAGGAKTTLDMTGPGGTVTTDVDLRMTGTGTLQLNVDKGFVKTGGRDMKLEMTLLMSGMTMTLNGTIHLVVTGTPQPH